MKQKIRSFIINILTNTIGKLLVLLQPNKARKLSEQGMTLVLNNMSMTERLMRRALLNDIEKAKDYDTLAALHQNYWSNQGAEFFEATNESFENKFLPDCSFIFDLLKQELTKHPVEFNTLVEIGTGNGRVLEYLSLEFPKIKHFVGIDLSSVQVEINKKRFQNNNKLQFIASDGFEWVKQQGQANTIFVTSRGVLEYFTENRLQAFLKEIHGLGKTIFIAIEPNDISHNFNKNPNSQPYGSERSFSHNYPKLFKDSGFNLWHVSYKNFNESVIQCFVGAMN